MDDSKTMPCPTSPQSPLPPVDRSGIPRTRSAFKSDDRCEAVPLYVPTSLPSSPRPSVPPSTMAAVFQDNAHSSSPQEQRPAALLDMTEPHTMPWSTNGHPVMSIMSQDDSGLMPPPFYQGMASPMNCHEQTGFEEPYNLAYNPGLNTSVPRSLTNSFDLTSMPGSGINLTSYPPSMYQRGPMAYEGLDYSQSPNNNLIQLEAEYEDIKHEEVASYSPYYSDDSALSTPYGASPLLSAAELAAEKDLPYAQLIRRALLEAPNHTMVLRDIYEWFQKNTDKAADKETKGWQNSIRHNLSMNGAFEKVDQPCDESKRGFMWRLTAEAAKNGVRSTTRYRSKQPNKRGHRAGNYPQRQRAGAIGGIKAKKAALQRKARLHDCYRSDAYQSRSVPTPATFDALYTPSLALQNTPYPPSPYYSSSSSEVDALDYTTSYSSSPLQMSQSLHPMHSFSSLPMLPHHQDVQASPFTESVFNLPSDPSEPLFTNSPTPPASEPRTPDSEGPVWSGPLGTGSVSHGTFETFVSSYAHEPRVEYD